MKFERAAATESMRAALYRTTGPATEVLRLVEMPRPEPAAGEVRVRVCTSGVDAAGVRMRGAAGASLAAPAIVPGSDGAGVIDAVGAGVNGDRLGERVWLWNAQRDRAFGTAAQWIALPAAQAVVLPDGVSTDAGACLGTAALAAMHAVLAGGGVAGRRVLVSDGAGALGRYAVQFARLAGAALVIASAPGALAAGIALDAGAHAAINPREDDIVRRVQALTEGRGVDRIVEDDAAANLALDVQLLRRGGEIVACGSGRDAVMLPFDSAAHRQMRIRCAGVQAMRGGARRQAIAQLQAWLERGLIAHRVAARMPLGRIAEAHALVEAGQQFGSVLLAID